MTENTKNQLQIHCQRSHFTWLIVVAVNNSSFKGVQSTNKVQAEISAADHYITEHLSTQPKMLMLENSSTQPKMSNLIFSPSKTLMFIDRERICRTPPGWLPWSSDCILGNITPSHLDPSIRRLLRIYVSPWKSQGFWLESYWIASHDHFAFALLDHQKWDGSLVMPGWSINLPNVTYK